MNRSFVCSGALAVFFRRLFPLRREDRINKTLGMMLPLGKILALVVFVDRMTESQMWVPLVPQNLFQNYNPLQIMRPPAVRTVYVKVPRVLPEVDFSKPKTQSFYKSSLVPSQKPVYEFRYKVHDPKEENYQEKSETRVGESVKGYYSVREPDGYLRLVKYVSDENGFQTQVSHHHTDDNGGGYLFAMSQHIT